MGQEADTSAPHVIGDVMRSAVVKNLNSKEQAVIISMRIPPLTFLS